MYLGEGSHRSYFVVDQGRLLNGFDPHVSPTVVEAEHVRKAKEAAEVTPFWREGVTQRMFTCRIV